MKALATVAMIGGLLLGRGCDAPAPNVTFATFNIEDYPKSDGQVDEAFRMIRVLGASAIGVQEITDVAHFEREAKLRLGPEWRFVYAPYPRHRIGVLFDERVFELESTYVHEDTVIGGAGKPAFEARLRKRMGGQVARLIVVHLKALGDGVDLRRKQLAGLERTVERGRKDGELIVLLGDFNATSQADRTRIAALARATDLVWASEGLPCTSYWNRRDGCLGTALDHVLTSEAPKAIVARGPCQTVGCDKRNQCPRFHRDVSDHCPVVSSWGLPARAGRPARPDRAAGAAVEASASGAGPAVSFPAEGTPASAGADRCTH